MGLEEFLRYAQGAGVNVIVGVILSYVIEFWDGFENLTAKAKRLIIGALCFVVPIGALLLKVALGFEGFNQDTLWGILVNAFAAFTASQAAHLRKLPE